MALRDSILERGNIYEDAKPAPAKSDLLEKVLEATPPIEVAPDPVSKQHVKKRRTRRTSCGIEYYEDTGERVR